MDKMTPRQIEKIEELVERQKTKEKNRKILESGFGETNQHSVRDATGKFAKA